MKIALGQTRIISNNPEYNFNQIQNFINQAIERNVDLVIFGELSLPGVFVSKRNLTDEYVETVLNYNQKIIELSKDIDILWGSYEKDAYLYNAALYASQGKLVDTAHKENLNVSIYEDQVFKSNKKNFKIRIEGEDYTVSLDQHEEHTIFITSHVYKHDSPLEDINNSIMATGVGIYNDGKQVHGIQGNAYMMYHNIITEANNVFESELLVQDTTHLIEFLNVPNGEILPNILPIIEMFDEEHLSFKPTWVVGVSGGLDSSVSLALLALALGEERVHGVTMPGNFTRDITLSNAYHLAQKLEVSFEEIPIKEMVDATVNSLQRNDYGEIKGLSYENIQARLRGHTLMSVASLRNGVVANNGNKIETALGYATLYGDAIGALSLLADLTKLEVGQLALEINEAYEETVIPLNLIPQVSENTIKWEFAPSAELSQDQFDPFKWGYHDHLITYLLTNSAESVLSMYLDKTIQETSFGKFMAQYNLIDNPQAFIEDLEWLLRTLQGASFKRIQTPPFLRLSSTSFGVDNQTNVYQTEEYQKLKETLLKNI